MLTDELAGKLLPEIDTESPTCPVVALRLIDGVGIVKFALALLLLASVTDTA